MYVCHGPVQFWWFLIWCRLFKLKSYSFLKTAPFFEIDEGTYEQSIVAELGNWIIPNYFLAKIHDDIWVHITIHRVSIQRAELNKYLDHASSIISDNVFLRLYGGPSRIRRRYAGTRRSPGSSQRRQLAVVLAKPGYAMLSIRHQCGPPTQTPSTSRRLDIPRHKHPRNLLGLWRIGGEFMEGDTRIRLIASHRTIPPGALWHCNVLRPISILGRTTFESRLHNHED